MGAALALSWLLADLTLILSVQGRMHAPLLSAAVSSRLAAPLYHCNHIYKHLLFIQVCSGLTPVKRSTAVQGRMHPTAQCCFVKQAGSTHVSLQVHP